MLTVAQCCLSPSWGGLEQIAVELASALRRRQIRSLALARSATPVAREIAAERIAGLAVAARDYWSPRAAREIRRFIARERVQLLHAHRGTDLWLLVPAAKSGREKRSPRLVLTSHILFRRVRKRGLLHRWLYRRVDRVIALTELSRRFLLSCLPLAPEQVVVIPNGIDLRAFPSGPGRQAARVSVRASWGAAADAPVLGLVGRLDPKKGQLEAITALAAIRRRYNDARLVLVGSETVGESGEERRLRQRSAELGVSDAVLFLGARQDVPGLLPGFDLLLVPSHSETFGRVVLEGMAAGVPVVATDAGGPPEILDRGRAGVLVPPRDPEALASAVIALLDDNEHRSSLSAAALARVQAEYALERVLDRTVELYRELVPEEATESFAGELRR